MSENQVVKAPKGRLHWVIPVLEIIIAAIYLFIGFGGIKEGFSNMDIKGMFESVSTAIWFLIIAIAVVTVLCFLPAFKSKANKRIGIWNIIWLALTLYSLVS